MKATLRSGRDGNAKHNERSIDLEKAKHIDREKTRYNHVVAPKVEGQGLQEKEISRYRLIFAKDIKAKREKYHARRQYKREADYTAEKLYHGARTKPDENIYQYGSLKDGTIRGEDLEKLYLDYKKRCMKEIPGYKEKVLLLSYAVHVDEATPHIHERVCYRASDGSPSQKKALQEMGFDKPDPEHAEDRYNNPKMPFTKKCREIWYEVIQEHGLELDTEPVHGRKHLPKHEYILGQLQQEKEAIKDELRALKHDSMYEVARKELDKDQKLKRYENLEVSYPLMFQRMDREMEKTRQKAIER